MTPAEINTFLIGASIALVLGFVIGVVADSIRKGRK